MNPTEFHNFEALVGPKLGTNFQTRISQTMLNNLGDFASRHNTDKSVIVRAAIHAYMAKYDFDAFSVIAPNQ